MPLGLLGGPGWIPPALSCAPGCCPVRPLPPPSEAAPWVVCCVTGEPGRLSPPAWWAMSLLPVALPPPTPAADPWAIRWDVAPLVSAPFRVSFPGSGSCVAPDIVFSLLSNPRLLVVSLPNCSLTGENKFSSPCPPTPFRSTRNFLGGCGLVDDLVRIPHCLDRSSPLMSRVACTIARRLCQCCFCIGISLFQMRYGRVVFTTPFYKPHGI